MKKTININFQGQLITIEETAYHLLNQYIESLKIYFSRDAEGNEIVNDIENRIAELFGNRLKHGIPCITDDDVTAIIDTIGRVEDFDELDDEEATLPPPHPKGDSTATPPPLEDEPRKKLYRKSNDKILGGVCSGLAHYLKIDPVFVRLAFVFLSSLLFWVYIVMWIILLPKELPNNVSKRLYRNPNDRFIGGVASGIAAYFRIDTWIPRLIFLLPLLFNMLGWLRVPLNFFSNVLFSSSFPFNLSSSVNISFVGIYIVLWIIVPKAVTVKQKLEMMGEEEYLRTIRETVSGNVAQSRSSRADAAASATVGASVTPVAQSTTVVDDSIDKPTETENTKIANNATAQGATPPPPPPPYTAYASAQPQRSGCLSFFIGMTKVLFFGIVGVVVAGFMILLFTLIFAGAKLAPLQSLFLDAGFEHTLLWVSIILTLLIPFVGVIIWLVRRVMKAKSRPIIGIVVAGLWFVGIVAGLTLGFKVTRKFSIESLQENNIELTTPTNNKLYVDMARYPLDYFSVTPGTSNIIIGPHRFGDDETNTLPFYNVEEDSLLFNSIELRIKTSSDTLFHVKTIYSSFDSKYKGAKANLKEFDFRLEQNDSVLWIPQFFKTPIEQGYRKQFVVVEIFVPSGSKLEVSQELEDYQQRISSQAMRRRYGRDYGYRNSLEWNSNEEYLLEGETLTETNLLNDKL